MTIHRKPIQSFTYTVTGGGRGTGGCVGGVFGLGGGGSGFGGGPGFSCGGSGVTRIGVGGLLGDDGEAKLISRFRDM